MKSRRMTGITSVSVLVLTMALASLAQSDSEPSVDASPPAAGSPLEGAKVVRIGTFLAASGDEVSMPGDARWSGNIHAVVRGLFIAGGIDGDLLAAGNDVRVSGEVLGDSALAGQNIRVDGVVAGDLRVAGQNVRVNGSIGGDLVGFAQDLTVGVDASIAGPAILYGGFITVSGDLSGPAQIGGGQVTLGGIMRSDVRVRCDRFVLREGVRIEGDLVYESLNDPVIPDGMVAGEVRRIEPTAAEDAAEAAERSDAAFQFFSPFRLALACYFAAISLISGVFFWLLFDRLVRRSIEQASHAAGFASACIIGLIVALGSIAVAGACFVLGPLWLALVAASLALFFFGGLIGRMILGRLILRPLIGREPHPIVALITGLVALLVAGFLLGLLPWIGGPAAFLLRAIVVVTGVGAIVQELRGRAGGARTGSEA